MNEACLFGIVVTWYVIAALVIRFGWPNKTIRGWLSNDTEPFLQIGFLMIWFLSPVIVAAHVVADAMMTVLYIPGRLLSGPTGKKK